MSPNATFRDDTFTELFNPTNTTPPFFQVFDQSFLDILGSNATVRAIAADPTFAFAHEAPIWNPTTDEVTFCSNDGGPLGHNDINTNSQVFKISLTEVADAIASANSSTAAVNVTVTPVRLESTDSCLFAAQTSWVQLDLPDDVQVSLSGTRTVLACSNAWF